MQVGPVFGMNGTGQAAPMGRLVSMLEEKNQTPLERARRALLNAKEKFEQQRDERMEEALPGYKALCSRRNSFEEGLAVQREQLEDFQVLSSRRERLAGELSSAKASAEAGGTEAAGLPSLESSRHTAALEDALAAVERDISALVEGANRYAGAQRQYADYLERTEQNGYAAFAYRDCPELTEESFLSGTSEMAERFAAGAAQWRERISDYCESYGLTASDFERYLQERNSLGAVYAAARQRYLELLNAAEGAVSDGSGGSVESAQGASTPKERAFDRVELSGAVRRYAQETVPRAGTDEETQMPR